MHIPDGIRPGRAVSANDATGLTDAPVREPKIDQNAKRLVIGREIPTPKGDGSAADRLRPLGQPF